MNYSSMAAGLYNEHTHGSKHNTQTNSANGYNVNICKKNLPV